MRQSFLAVITALAVALAATGPALAAGDPASDKQKLGYSLGYQIGMNVKMTHEQNKVDIDNEAFLHAVRDALTGAKPAVAEEDMKATLKAFQQAMMERQQALSKEQGEKNRQEGEKFLAENKKVKGVVTLPSGLQYQVLKEGKGRKPTLDDTVVAHYESTLIDGKVVDSSVKRGEKAEFPLKAVIKGWQQALQLMPLGSKWKVFVPADLAYGPGGAGPFIGPNTTLIFEIELFEIRKGDAAKAAPATPAKK